MSSAEASSQYKLAQKQGQKYVKTCLAAKQNPYPQVLEQMVSETAIAGRRNLGVVEIPMELIVGTRVAGRQNAFAGNFMPLLSEKTEFGMKWVRLCDAHLGDVGITDPILCYEYLGKFYVQEGNKRVSVLKSYDCTSIPGTVIRLIPVWEDEAQIRAYYEFMQFYELSHLYQVQFERPGNYAKLQAALGFDPDHVWTDDERSAFLSGYHWFRRVFEEKKERENAAVTLSEALLMWLQLYSLADLRAMSAQELEKSLDALWPDILFMSQNRTATLSTAPEREEERGFLDKLFASRVTHLNVAFVHSVSPEVSRWSMGHELGREDLADTMGEFVDIQSYCVGEHTADELMEQAVAEGAELIVATSPSLITASRKIAAKYPELRVMNCALSLPYAGIRTYYCRIHEAKFITGAIAGLMTEPGEAVGYVANYPIFGVPAAINAYALGVRMTNPTAKVRLGWSCVEQRPALRMMDEGVRLISNREFNATETSHKGINWGTYLVQPDGSRRPLASPCWNWGRFYEKAVRAILDGSWNPQETGTLPITYWWGMDTGVIDISIDPDLPAGVIHLAKILKAGLCDGSIDPFHCQITDQNGVLRNDGESWFTPEEVMQMDWLCDNVEGEIPKFEEILPMSRNMVRLLGVYRDEIPPEKEAPGI